MHQSALIRDEQGFTLAETAIVLAIIAAVIGTLVPSFLSIRVAEQGRVSVQNIQTVMRSISAFVQASGCVPCPTPAASVNDNGRGIVRGDEAATPPNCGVCNRAVGLVPYRSLGLPESLAKDGYGRWLTYAVDRSLTTFTIVPFTGTTGICTNNNNPPNRLRVNLSEDGDFQSAAVMLISHGANGYGAYVNFPESDTDRFAFPAVRPACDAANVVGAERCNASDTTTFVDTLRVQGDDAFDDVMMYLNRNTLVSYNTSSNCTTNWGTTP